MELKEKKWRQSIEMVLFNKKSPLYGCEVPEITEILTNDGDQGAFVAEQFNKVEEQKARIDELETALALLLEAKRAKEEFGKTSIGYKVLRSKAWDAANAAMKTIKGNLE